ncbi:Bgt-50502 [Blumeria graminis f. sp. tritici]|uniref:Bgt-50502 n=1 Tax=Blumeria graminis f. sp. tritici TaxID=62690 RepID=A0A9X9QD14_BLUGR|nr:Bgt-50502 [Blumeria graminis f. sp. tritici]
MLSRQSNTSETIGRRGDFLLEFWDRSRPLRFNFHRSSRIAVSDKPAQHGSSTRSTNFSEQKEAELAVFAKEQSEEVLNAKLTELTNAMLAALYYDNSESTLIYMSSESRELTAIGNPMCEKARALAQQEQMEESAYKKRKLQHKVDSDANIPDTSPSDFAKTIRNKVEKALKKSSPKFIFETIKSGKTPQGIQTENSESQSKGGLSRKRKREWEKETSAEVTKLLDLAHRTSFNPKCFSSNPEAFFIKKTYCYKLQQLHRHLGYPSIN